MFTSPPKTSFQTKTQKDTSNTYNDKLHKIYVSEFRNFIVSLLKTSQTLFEKNVTK